MRRLWYYVVDLGERWTICLRDNPYWDSPVTYLTCDEATGAARRLAQEEWALGGDPTGVRVPAPLGKWRDEIRFGEERSTGLWPIDPL